MISTFRRQSSGEFWRFLPFTVHSTGGAKGVVVRWSLVTWCWRWHRRCNLDSSFRTHRLRGSSRLCSRDQLTIGPSDDLRRQRGACGDSAVSAAAAQQYQRQSHKQYRWLSHEPIRWHASHRPLYQFTSVTAHLFAAYLNGATVGCSAHSSTSSFQRATRRPH